MEKSEELLANDHDGSPPYFPKTTMQTYVTPVGQTH
jgi:hypothetical protein